MLRMNICFQGAVHLVQIRNIEYADDSKQSLSPLYIQKNIFFLFLYCLGADVPDAYLFIELTFYSNHQPK